MGMTTFDDFRHQHSCKAIVRIGCINRIYGCLGTADKIIIPDLFKKIKGHRSMGMTGKTQMPDNSVGLEFSQGSESPVFFPHIHIFPVAQAAALSELGAAAANCASRAIIRGVLAASGRDNLPAFGDLEDL